MPNTARSATALALFIFCLPALRAEVCTTQAKMAPSLRDALTDTALSLATAVQANDAPKLRAATIAEYAANFTNTEFLIRTTSTKVTGQALKVTSVFSLDATARKPNETAEAEFTCPLTNTSLEADFSIPGLPPGNYGFAIVEASGGPQPWLLSFLMRNDGGVWKMAGFYPHARTAAGHDGLWYWNEARAAAKAKQPWAAYLLYAEAYALLRPAGFVETTHLDKLQNEQRTASPTELSNGISKDTPLVLKDATGEFHFTALTTDRSDDGTRVNIMLHMPSNSTDAAATRVRNEAAAAAFVKAHPEVRKDFQGVWVFAETDAQQPFVMTQRDMSQIPQ